MFSDTPRPSLSLRSVLREAGLLLRTQPSILVGAALVCGLPALADAHVESAVYVGTVTLDPGESILLSVILFVLGRASHGALLALGAHVAVSARRGSHERAGEHLGRVLSRIVPLTVAMVFVTLSGLFAAFFLVLPGVFVQVILVFTAAACTFEGLDLMSALERSAALTRGNRLRILALMCIVHLPILALVALHLWIAYRVMTQAPDPNMTMTMFAVALRAPIAHPAYLYAANVLVALAGSVCFGVAYVHVADIRATADVAPLAEEFA